MVSFSHVPYREALQAGKDQAVLLERIAALEDIENQLERHPEVDRLFWEWKKRS
jgi:hypothetical protein